VRLSSPGSGKRLPDTRSVSSVCCSIVRKWGGGAALAPRAHTLLRSREGGAAAGSVNVLAIGFACPMTCRNPPSLYTVRFRGSFLITFSGIPVVSYAYRMFCSHMKNWSIWGVLPERACRPSDFKSPSPNLSTALRRSGRIGCGSVSNPSGQRREFLRSILDD
jgi:hypothetical protein